MRSSIHIVLFFLLGLVASFAIPRPAARPQAQYAVVDFAGKEACHSILTACRVDTECCPGLQCKSFDGESLCVPGG
ncbi:hypothetical protein VTK26DRAFT_658 [Humicola hyalothermophila]